MPYEKIITLPSDASEGATPVADGSGGFSWQTPSGGGDANGFPKFDLLYEHTVTAAEATTVVRFAVTDTEVPEINAYNVFVASIEFAEETPLTKWAAMYINNTRIGTLCGTSNGKLSSYAASANRLTGKWVGTATYNPTQWVMPMLAVLAGSVMAMDDVVVTSVGIGSYGGDFGLVEGSKIRFYGAR